jgi:hypothetical protein
MTLEVTESFLPDGRERLRINDRNWILPPYGRQDDAIARRVRTLHKQALFIVIQFLLPNS